MTADTPTSVATINHLLLGAPYTSPLVIPGDWLVDELEGAVEVGGFTDGLFRWPTRKRSGRPSPILCGDRPRRPRPLAGPQGAAEGTGRLVQRRSRVHPPPRQQAQPGLVRLHARPQLPECRQQGRGAFPAQRARPQQCDLEQVRGRSVAPALPAARLAMVCAADRQDPRSGIPPGQEAGPATAAAETPVRPVAALSRRGERGPVLNRGSSAAPRRASC